MSHLLLDIYTHTRYGLDELRELMLSVCHQHQYKVLNVFTHQFYPQGETIVITLQNSHMSIHTYPERSMVAIDLYTCHANHHKHMETIRDWLVEMFNGDSKLYLIVNRPC